MGENVGTDETGSVLIRLERSCMACVHDADGRSDEFCPKFEELAC